MNYKKAAVFQIILIYIIVGTVGVLTYSVFKEYSEVQRFLFADLAMTIATFVFSVIKKNSSVYDAYWSVIPFYFVLMWIVLHFEVLGIHNLLVFSIISIWSWRLTLNWTRSWSGFHHEDWRYVDLAKKTEVWYPFVNFLGIHLFPTLMVFGCMWPLFWMFTDQIINWFLFAGGMAISTIGIGLELLADNQLAQFRNRPNAVKGEILNTGLWSICRHPNYLGEILFWLGLTLLGIAFGAPNYTGLGCLALILMFRFISIPMKEKRMGKFRDDFDSYRKHVPLLIPKMKFKK